jgi:hypothetical protein
MAMDFLETVLTGMKEQEVREFRYFLNRHPQGSGSENGMIRRDLVLIDLIRKNPEDEKDQDFALQIYGNKDRNAYHQLRNRLRKSLEEFLFFENSRRGNEYEIRKHIEIARYLFQKNAWPQALLSIEKAEKLALEGQNYSELSALYNLLILYSARMPWISLRELMDKRKKNQEKLDQKFHYLFIISEIREMLESGDKLKSHIDIDYAVSRIMHQHHIQDEDPEHAILWLDIASLVSEVLLNKNLLDILEQYLILKHREFGEKPVYSSAGNGYRLRMLWQIIGLLFLKNRFEILDKYLFELKHEAAKLRDIYPEMEDRLRCVEAIAGLHTGQLARSQQNSDLIRLKDFPSLAVWKHWIDAQLAAKNQETQQIQDHLSFISLQKLPSTADHLLLALAICNLVRQQDLPLNKSWNTAAVQEHFRSLQQQEFGNSLLEWMLPDRQETLPNGRLPEAGSLGFIARGFVTSRILLLS